MKVRFGKGKTEYGPGVDIILNGNEIASAIDLYLYAKGVFVSGARTISINKVIAKDCKASVYVDPSGEVIANRKRYNGSGKVKRGF